MFTHPNTLYRKMARVKTRTAYQKWVKLVMKSIAGLAPQVFRWSNRFRGDCGRQCKTTVDGTDFRIPEPHPFSQKWFTKKFSGPGVCYEVAICIQSGDIVRINGPYHCGQWLDIKIFRHKPKHIVPAGEKVEADKGYRGEPNHVRLPGNAVSKADKAAKEAARARHETGKRLFKRWGCLFQCYRHDIDEYYLHFASVAVCV